MKNSEVAKAVVDLVEIMGVLMDTAMDMVTIMSKWMLLAKVMVVPVVIIAALIVSHVGRFESSRING